MQLRAVFSAAPAHLSSRYGEYEWILERFRAEAVAEKGVTEGKVTGALVDWPAQAN